MGFSIDATGLADTRKQVESLGRKVIAEMAQLQIVLTRERTARGIGVHDQAMPQKADGSTRTLLDTGSMLRAMHTQYIKPTNRGWEAINGFSTREDAMKAAYNQLRDPWYGISPEDAKQINRLAQQYLNDMKKGTA